jgi:CBS domain-containing protein
MPAADAPLNLKYLTDLIGKPVENSEGRRVGRVLDAIATQGGRLPTLSALFIKGRAEEGWVPISAVELLERCVLLKESWPECAVYQPSSRDLRLQRDILDKQIVDVHDYRVVRVNDVRLAPCGDGSCVVGVDAGLRAIVRRTGIGGPVEAVAKMLGRPLSAKLIAWDDVEALEPGSAGGGRIKLKVSHEKIARLHPADIADIVEQLDPHQRAEVIEALDVETAADTLEEMEEASAASVMEHLEEEVAADILEEMDPDEAADLLADLTEERSEELLEHMQPEEAAEVQELLAYEPESAGGVMTTEFIAIPTRFTARDTIKRLRELKPKAETVYYLYVTDDDERLVGVISLRDLVVSDPKTPVSDFMVTNVRSVGTWEDAEETARQMSKYDLLAMPVVDGDRRLVGIILLSDVVDRYLPPEKRKRLPQLTVADE